MLKFPVSLLLVLLLSSSVFAQQDPGFTQYTYNMSVVNPAYSTTDFGILNLGALYRKQWVSAVGSPTTMTFFAHTPFSEKIEMGVTVTNDQIGQDVAVLNKKYINIDFAYVLDINAKSKISLGLKGGCILNDDSFTGATIDPDDPAFENGISQFLPSVGAGAYYFTDNYYVGLSVPNFIRSDQISYEGTMTTLGKEEIHYYLIGGYVFPVNDVFKLKPSFMLRAVKGAPYNLDVSLNSLLYDRFELGVSYRYGDAISGLIGIRATPALKIAYSYDATVSEFSSYNNGSHEIILLFDVSLFGLNKGYKKSPRFF